MTFPEADIFLKSGNCLRKGHFVRTVFSFEAPRTQPACPVPLGKGVQASLASSPAATVLLLLVQAAHPGFHTRRPLILKGPGWWCSMLLPR